MKSFSLACRFLRREINSPEWFIIFVALFISIAATTALHFYTERLTRGLEEQGSKILGGNLVVTSPTAIPEEWVKKANTFHLTTAEVWDYPSMFSVNNQLQMINLQAVSKTFPLIGNKELPALGTVWIEPRLFSLLNVQVGSLIKIGNGNFIISRATDNAIFSTGFLIAPRVMMRLEDVPSTKTVIPGSRVDYRLLLAGRVNDLQAFQQWLAPQLKSGQRFLTIRNSQNALNNIVQQTENFLQLALIVCLIITGAAIALSIQIYLQKNYDTVALWRCLGAKQSQVVGIFLWRLFIVAILIALLGVIAGYFLQNLFANLFQHYFPFPLPPTGFAPAVLGFATSIFLLFAFAYPVITALPQTSPLFLWRKEMKTTRSETFYFVLASGILLFFLFWLMNYSLLVLFFLNALVVSVGVIFIVNYFLLKLLKSVVKKTRGTLRQGLNQLIHHPENVGVQVTVWTLILTAILILLNVQSNILHRWQSSLPSSTPNYFVVNIGPQDISAIKKTLQMYQVNFEDFYPIVRGRIISLNNKPILSAIPENARGHNALHRDLNLSWMWKFPSDNKLVAGKTWTQADKGQHWVSVEQNLAEDLHLKLGDQLTFKVGEDLFSATIVNFRSLEWTSFHPNFFMIFLPGLLDKFPTTYMTSFYLHPGQTTILNQLVNEFPNVTIIDVASLLQQIQTLIASVSQGIKYLFFFTVLVATLILIVMFRAGLEERKITYRLFTVLGASKNYIRRSLWVEYITMFFIIFMFSYILSEVIMQLVMKRFF